MADIKKTTYKIEGLQEVFDALGTLTSREALVLIRSTNRKALTKNIIKPVRAALPYSAETKKTVKVVTDTENRKTGLYAGVTPDGYVLRFLEYGTRVRVTSAGINRGRIRARHTIEPVIDNRVKDVVDFFNNEYGDALADIMRRKIKRIDKKLKA